MKIELGKKPTQKVPSSEDIVEEEYRLLYKEQTGKSALYKRNGEWKESKLYKEWRNKKLAKLHEEVQEVDGVVSITSEELDKKNLLKMFDIDKEMKKMNKQLGKSRKSTRHDDDDDYGYTEVDICHQCEERKMIDPRTACCEKCDDENDKKARQTKKDNEPVPPYDKVFQRRTLFLWNLMSEKMDFETPPDDEDIKELTKIKESLKHWLDEED